ncbi:helicase-related protein [Candidatus Amarolinea dominans]|uniref:SWIM zinc finger family protein n=1 Tax=Candidatus Amarolinea dominans TaxID=3140696 RepID=UPI001D66D523|nr:hypothetical protein [Anaerolineae bacterium]
MVKLFQSGNGPRLFMLSLKAGGVGLNLTQANHVFHFDRWWNPAVENQATDRAFRIGQQRNVQVHKFICAGTLEEKIDQLIESKKELANSIVGGRIVVDRAFHGAVARSARAAAGCRGDRGGGMSPRRASYREDNDHYFAPSRPLRADGIRAEHQTGAFAKSWWADRWIAALERLVDSGRLARGRAYARKGQVLEINIEPGKVSARVQGSRPTPYKITINIGQLTNQEWERVLTALAAQAIFTASLLNGEMPPDVETAFDAAKGLPLSPNPAGPDHQVLLP